jgi:hypothetical protein
MSADRAASKPVTDDPGLRYHPPLPLAEVPAPPPAGSIGRRQRGRARSARTFASWRHHPAACRR